SLGSDSLESLGFHNYEIHDYPTGGCKAESLVLPDSDDLDG
ncbi:hypothetical protein A2U01_0102328, partial [Trifolium medium]|nr:hypothetical protein [Trifolium medium]